MKAAAESKQGVDPDLKDFLDSYEAFVDEYVVFMQQYSKNPTDLSLLARYTDIMQKYSDFAVKVEKYDTKEMSTEDAAYYLEVTSRYHLPDARKAFIIICIKKRKMVSMFHTAPYRNWNERNHL